MTDRPEATNATIERLRAFASAARDGQADLEPAPRAEVETRLARFRRWLRGMSEGEPA